MTIATKLNLTVAALIVCFLVMLEGSTHGPLLGYSTNWPGAVALFAFVGFSIVYAIFFIKRAREKGLNLWLAYFLMLVPIFCISLSILGILDQQGVFLFSPLGYCTLLLCPSKEKGMIRGEVTMGALFALSLVSIDLLHGEGYKLFGHTYFYREPPPKDEQWIEVQEIEPQGLRLANGEFVPFEHYEIPDFAFSHSQDDLSVLMFHVPLSDLYVRKTQSGEWNARFGNFAICSHPHFFPEREYGYYESSSQSWFEPINFDALNEDYIKDIHKRYALLEQY